MKRIGRGVSASRKVTPSGHPVVAPGVAGKFQTATLLGSDILTLSTVVLSLAAEDAPGVPECLDESFVKFLFLVLCFYEYHDFILYRVMGFVEIVFRIHSAKLSVDY